MRLAHIAPTSVLKTAVFKHLDFHLAIASQVRKDTDYAKYYRDAKGFVILDVPTREEKDYGNSYRLEYLIEACGLIQPSEVTLPDVWGGTPEQSIRSAEDASYWLSAIEDNARGHLGYLVVPRGSCWEEYVECAEAMSKIPGVNTIGIVDGTYEKFKVGRLQIVLDFVDRFSQLNLHLLGVRRDLTDIQDRRLCKYCRSADTAKFVRFGLECKRPLFKNVPDYTGRGEGYFEREVSEIQLSYIQRNIQYWNNFVQTHHVVAR